MTAELTFKVMVEIHDEYRDEALKEASKIFLISEIFGQRGVIRDVINHDNPVFVLTEITEL